ncbi:MAG: DVUA0089 family protein [Euzebya sp.]
MTSRSSLRSVVVMVALLASLLAVSAAPVHAQNDGSVSIIKDNEAPSNAEIAVRLSEATDLASVQRVVISRDDNFADALASGLLQRNAPLLLVPPNGPVPPRVLGEIQRVGAGEALILGGSGAVSPTVADELVAAGLSVQRRQGGSRIETAIDIADQEAGSATTAILARAFPADPDNPTQAFADALGAGALSAEMGWPILLSTTEELAPATREYLAESDITQVKLVGGTAALSAAVENQIREMGIDTSRIAGDTRGGTALEIAKEQGADTAADVSHVILVDGTGDDAWAGGFAAAGRAALLDAPILLADGVRLLPETDAFLTPGTSFAQAGDLTITCVVHPLACTEGRRALGLIDVPILALDPPRGVRVDPGLLITATLTPTEEGAGVEVLVDGDCVGDSQLLTTDAAGQATFSMASELPPGRCQLTVSYAGTASDAFLRSTVVYDTEGPGARSVEQAFVGSDVLAYGEVVPDQPVIVNDTITCTPPGGQPQTMQGSAYQAQNQQPGAPGYDFVNLGSDPLITSPQSACTVSVEVPPQTQQVLWGLYSFSDSGLRVPLLLGQGTTANFDLAAVAQNTGADVRDVSVRWVLQIDDLLPSAPQPPPPGESGIINNPDNLLIICDGESVGPGFRIVEVGAQCSSSISAPGFNILLVQPDRVNQSQPSVTFEVPADTRITTLRAQFIYIPFVPGQDGLTCPTARPLQIGRLTSGALTQPRESQYFRFDGVAGESLRIRLDDAFGNQGLDPIVSLFGPDGTRIAENDDGDDGLNSRLDVTLPESGSYCVQAHGYETSYGDFLLAVDDAPVFIDSGVFSPEFPVAEYTYNGVAGDLLVLELRRADFDQTDPILEIYDSVGNLVAFDDDGGGYPNSRIEFVLPSSGDFVVAGSVFDDFYGAFTFEATFPTGGYAAATTSGSGGLARRTAGN